MSYTPHTWVDDETITYQKLNAMEQGIANAGGGSSDVVLVYYPNSTVGYQTTGNFAVALNKVQSGVPFAAYMLSYNTFSGGFTAYPNQNLIVAYDENYPNQIDLQITGGVGIIWTANGLEYYD